MCSMLLLVGAAACSSEPTGEGAGPGGPSGGSGGSKGGIITSGAGGRSQADCDNAPVVCLDANTASTCDGDTLQDTSIDCNADAKELGIISNGCEGDKVRGTCSIDGYADEACEAGVVPFAVCNDLGQADALNIYVACYLDEQGLHDVIPCFADYVDEAMKTVDCVAAEVCFGDVPPAGGEGGAGGAGATDPDAAGGAGG